MLPLGTCGRAKWRKAWPSCFTAARTTSRRIIEPLCPNSVDGNVFQIPCNIRMDQVCAGILLHVPFISIHQPKQWQQVHDTSRNCQKHASACICHCTFYKLKPQSFCPTFKFAWSSLDANCKLRPCCCTASSIKCISWKVIGQQTEPVHVQIWPWFRPYEKEMEIDMLFLSAWFHASDG